MQSEITTGGRFTGCPPVLYLSAGAFAVIMQAINPEFMGDNIIEIKKLHQDFSVCKVMDYSLVNINAEYSFIGKTDEENSLVCITSDVPLNVIQRDDGWKGFRIQGILDFSLIGILSKIAEILAKNSISIFAISTYNTDYVLIKKEKYQKALDILKHSGYEITE